MRILSLVLVLSLCSFAQIRTERRPGAEPPAEAKPATPPSKKDLKLAADLIQRAQGLTADLNDTDRAYALARMAELSAKRNPEQSVTWAEEAYRLAANLPGVAQGSVQMSALMAVSQNNLDRALEMLGAMESPRQTANGTFTPDIRAASAAMLFTRAYTKEGDKAVERLQTTARQMGENSFYPYMAVTQLINAIAKKDKERAQNITNDAVAFINRRKRSQMENQQVTMFLTSAQEFIPLPMMKEILETVVKEALDQAKQSDGSQVAATFQNSAGDKVQLNSMATLMVFQLMPLIRNVDPDWAKKLEEQSDELRRASALMRSGDVNIMIGASQGGPTGPNGNRRDFRDEVQSMQVDELASRDPKRAMEMANNIQDPVLHAAAMTRVTASSSDAQAREKALRDAKELLARTSEPRDKLIILSGLAQAQATMKDEEGLATTLDQGLVIADDLFRRSIDRNPSAGAWMRPGVDVATSLIKGAVKTQGKLVTDKLDAVRQAPLKALLLLAAAEALDPESRPTNGPQLRFSFSA